MLSLINSLFLSHQLPTSEINQMTLQLLGLERVVSEFGASCTAVRAVPLLAAQFVLHDQ